VFISPRKRVARALGYPVRFVIVPLKCVRLPREYAYPRLKSTGIENSDNRKLYL
jgi:hypothetical protein